LKTANAALPASVAANVMALPNAARIAIHARLLIANAPHASVAVNVKVLMNAVRTVIRELKSQDAAVRFCFRLCKN